MKKTTMADVAREAGVSKSTVSQYVNGRYDYMSEQTKQTIERAIEALSYRPNTLARSLKQKQTSTIGVIVANLLNQFSSEVVRVVESVCHDEGFHVFVCNAEDDPAKEKQYIEMLLDRQVDGLVLFPTEANKAYYASLLKQGYPLVCLDRLVDGLDAPFVLLDHAQASMLAVDYLVSKGHRDIGFIGMPVGEVITARIERREAFEAAMRHRDLRINEHWLQNVPLDNMHDVLEDMFYDDGPTALIAANDQTLNEVLMYAKKKKMKLPEAFSVVSMDHVSYAPFFTPSITTIAQPATEMAECAAHWLLQWITSGERPSEAVMRRFAPKLTIRESCKENGELGE
ncbi:LacI family transcriptional regulator [Bacillaceae bacterium SIJ1]|uniref:LacI family DNA-binding transcriptional regulator n=1 Tax=Litoribacterium kuwaitense TaxID=1398745 RepID=UPI0013EB359D|nr:LacI family DNA-binding transcriptional regulator [Litoribacterium kuwaitense]NGP44831.1 LacI family transcriptional regulator [Litoribacterium kuwaitense]